LIDIADPAAATDASETLQDPDILTLIMELREELAGYENPKLIRDFMHQLCEKFQACQEEFAKAWATDKIALMRSMHIRLVYIQKLIDEANEKLNQLPYTGVAAC
jgi:hypothetical protein